MNVLQSIPTVYPECMEEKLTFYAFLIFLYLKTKREEVHIISDLFLNIISTYILYCYKKIRFFKSILGSIKFRFLLPQYRPALHTYTN